MPVGVKIGTDRIKNASRVPMLEIFARRVAYLMKYDSMYVAAKEKWRPFRYTSGKEWERWIDPHLRSFFQIFDLQ